MKLLQFKAICGLPVVLLGMGCWLSLPAILLAGPAFDCGKVEAGSPELHCMIADTGNTQN